MDFQVQLRFRSSSRELTFENRDTSGRDMQGRAGEAKQRLAYFSEGPLCHVIAWTHHIAFIHRTYMQSLGTYPHLVHVPQIHTHLATTCTHPHTYHPNKQSTVYTYHPHTHSLFLMSFHAPSPTTYTFFIDTHHAHLYTLEALHHMHFYNPSHPIHTAYPQKHTETSKYTHFHCHPTYQWLHSVLGAERGTGLGE